MLVRAYKFRLYPTKAQAALIDTWLMHCCELYNAALQERREAYRTANKRISWMDQQNQLPSMKNDRPEFRIVNAAVLQNVIRRVHFTHEAFFARIRHGERVGLPRFKSVRRYDSFTHPDVYWRIDQRSANFPNIGRLRWKPWKDIATLGKPKTCTIRREADGYYAVLACEISAPAALPASTTAIGLDVGVTKLITTNTGTVLGSLAPLKRLEHKMRKAQRRKDRRVLDSRRRDKAIRNLARHHQRLMRARKAQLDRISRKLIQENGTICIEDLDVVKLLQSGDDTTAAKGLRRNKHHASWAALRHMLTYKAEEAGRRIVAVPPYGTSQSCSGCGATVRKTLRDRVHSCDCCGLVIDRDTNAARNILQRGLQLLRREATELRRPEKITFDHG